MLSHQPSAISHGTTRLWRVRKEHVWIDAQLSAPHAGVARIDFFYDGSRIFSRDFETRDLAIDEAARTLHDLQRVGWTTHW